MEAPDDERRHATPGQGSARDGRRPERPGGLHPLETSAVGTLLRQGAPEQPALAVPLQPRGERCETVTVLTSTQYKYLALILAAGASHAPSRGLRKFCCLGSRQMDLRST